MYQAAGTVTHQITPVNFYYGRASEFLSTKKPPHFCGGILDRFTVSPITLSGNILNQLQVVGIVHEVSEYLTLSVTRATEHLLFGVIYLISFRILCN